LTERESKVKTRNPVCWIDGHSTLETSAGLLRTIARETPALFPRNPDSILVKLETLPVIGKAASPHTDKYFGRKIPYRIFSRTIAGCFCTPGLAARTEGPLTPARPPLGLSHCCPFAATHPTY